MSTTLPTTSKAPRANWNDAEITALINYLIEHMAEVGDGGNFKKATFTGALGAVGPHHSAGPQTASDSVRYMRSWKIKVLRVH
jgi:hypothetical protein